LGISRPDNGDVSSYVLNQFSEDEKIKLHGYLTKAAEALLFCLQEGIGSAMATYSKKSVI
jgi:peptidyl-tRNA hydrolase